jgi:hypothetical protein
LGTWRSQGSTRCFSNGSRSFIAGAITFCTALAVTKSRGAQRDIGGGGHSSSIPADLANTTTSVPYCPYYFTSIASSSS